MPPTATALTQAMAQEETGKDTKQHLAMGLTEMALALPNYLKAERYYDGKAPELFASAQVARALANTAGRFKLNFAKTPVNVVADRLQISSVTVNNNPNPNNNDDNPSNPATNPTTPTAQLNNDLTKTFNKLVWKKLNLRRKTKNLHLRASEFGDCYWFIWPDDNDSNQPCIYYNSPKNVRAIYDPENPDQVLFVIKRWKANNTEQLKLYYSDTILSFELTNPSATLKERDDPSAWRLTDTDENPFNRLPLFHFRNGDPYGTPEHYDGYGPQDAINKISTTMVHTTEFQGFPQRYGLADPNAAIGGDTMRNDDWDADSTNTDPDDDTDSALEGGPGSFLKLEGIREAGTWEAADSETFLKPAEFYIRCMAQMTTTPLRFFFPPGAHPPSGESFRAEDAPLTDKIKTRQDSYEDTFREAFAFCMEIITGQPADSFTIDVRWAPAASIDDALGWDTVKRKIDAGVPRRQALMEAGYTAEQVDDWLNNNVDKVEFKRDIDSLSVFAAAGKNLADTAAVHGLDQESVAKLLTTLLKKFAPELANDLKEPAPPPSTPDAPPPNPDPTQLADPHDPRNLNQPTLPTRTGTLPRPNATPPGARKPETDTTQV